MTSGLKNGIIVAVVTVVVGSLIAWGAWATTSVNALAVEKCDEEKFERHRKDNTDKFDSMQRQIVESLDEIQQTILDLHKE